MDFVFELLSLDPSPQLFLTSFDFVFGSHLSWILSVTDNALAIASSFDLLCICNVRNCWILEGFVRLVQ